MCACVLFYFAFSRHCGGKGCKARYHPSCALPPEENIYLLNCFCYDCTKKRLSFGVHSVSQGIESILGVREVESSDSEGTNIFHFRCIA